MVCWVGRSVGASDGAQAVQTLSEPKTLYRCLVQGRPVASSNHCQPQEEPIITSQDSPLPARFTLNGSQVQYFVIYEAIYAQINGI